MSRIPPLALATLLVSCSWDRASSDAGTDADVEVDGWDGRPGGAAAARKGGPVLWKVERCGQVRYHALAVEVGHAE
jgi:hypothetical protein